MSSDYNDTEMSPMLMQNLYCLSISIARESIVHSINKDILTPDSFLSTWKPWLFSVIFISFYVSLFTYC